MLAHIARHVVFAIPVLGLTLAACEGCRSQAANGPPTGAASPASDAGTPTARLYLISDLAGALEPCGCTKDQLGGLDHFGAWVKASRAAAPAAVVAAAGPFFFMDDRLEGERADQDRIKAEAIARVMHDLDFVAFSPGSNDWSDGADGMKKLTLASGATAMVGAAPFVVRDVGGLRVGFVGVGQGEGAPRGVDTQEAVRRGVDAAKKQGANALVALVAAGRGEAKRIADAVPELTAVVVGSAKSAGDGNTTAPPPEQIGDVLIVQAGNHLQSVAVLDLYVREPLQPGRLVKFADGTGLELARKREELTRRVDELHVKIAAWERDPQVAPADVAARREELGKLEAERDALDRRPPPATGSFFRYTIKEMRESLGRDPAIELGMRTYYKAVNEHNREAFAGRLPPAPGPDQAHYVGVEVCSTCHAGARTVWNATNHSRAYATLSSQLKEFNLECVGCHVTGYEQPGGSTVTHVAKLENVQCEVCHGPGSRHVQDPSDRTRIVAKPQASRCLECHHPPHVESFDPAAKMSEILGPGHGMPTR
jgi:hypothetical protein